MGKIRIGIVGAGGMAAYHIPGFRKAGADVAAVADPDTAKASKCATDFDIPKVYSSLKEMAETERLDAISIITPNKFHAPLAIEALKSGLNVYCEKPPALNAKETLAMAKASEKAGKKLLFGFCNRARPEAQALKKEIGSGRFGTVNSAEAAWIRRTGIPGFGGWFTTKALSGGGPLIDLLHGVDLALWFMGYPEPESVLARTFDDFIRDKRFRGPWGIPEKEDGVCDVESAVKAFITLKGGSCLIVRTSWAEMVEREEIALRLQGSKEGASIVRTFGTDGDDTTAVDTARLYTMSAGGLRRDRDLTSKKDETMGRIKCAENFIRTLQGREEPISDPLEAVRLMKIVDAMYESARSRRPVIFK